MKIKKFEKVIEWENEPDHWFIFFGFLMVIITILNLIFNFEKQNNFLSIFNMSIVIYVGIIIICSGLGEGKKVYYKEIKK